MEEQTDRKAGVTNTWNRSFRHELQLALVQYAAWPVAISVLGLLLLFWLLISGAELEILKGPGIEAHFRRAVAERGLSDELKKLRQLDDDQLQLFLIVGRDRAQQRITYSGPEAQPKNWEALRNAGLLEFTQIKEDTVDFTVFPDAHRLHSVVMQVVVRTITERKAK